MKNVLIVGGTGYVGSKLYEHLKNQYNVTTLDLEWYGNYVNKDNVKIDCAEVRAAQISKMDAIVFLAGHSSVKMCEDNMLSVMNNNVVNFVRFLGQVPDETTFIYASSSSVYGDTQKDIVSEDYIAFEPNNWYDLSKHEIDSYAKLSHKKYFGLRFGTVNGSSPNLRNDIMINAMTFNAKKNGKVFCFNPQIHRPILGIRDLVRAVGTIIEEGTHENRGIYNLASFNSTAQEIATVVADIMDCELEIVDTLPEVITNVKLQTKAYNFQIDSTKFMDTFQFSFEETVQSIVQSLKDDFEEIHKGNRSDVKLYPEDTL